MHASATPTVIALGSLDLFAGLSKKELAHIDQLTTPITVKAGKEFIKEGTVGREAFIITEGSASVWHQGRLVSSVGSGAIMGELSLLGGTPRSATVRAETEMTLEVLNRREFEQLLDENPRITRKLLTAVVNRVNELDPALLT